MDDFTIYSTIATTAFLQVPHLYTTNRLWKPIDSPFLLELLQNNVNFKDIINRKAICHVEPSWINLDATFVNDDMISIKATSSKMELNTISRVSLPLPMHGDDATVELEKMKRILANLSEKFNLELIVTNGPTYLAAKPTSETMSHAFTYMH